MQQTLLCECAWEVCNQVGGIYTVIRSKIPAIKKIYNDNYLLIGPYLGESSLSEFEEINDPKDPLFQLISKLNNNGHHLYYGYWLVSGHPRVILIDPAFYDSHLFDIKLKLWNEFKINSGNEPLVNRVLSFSFGLSEFLKKISKMNEKITAHFHEWMCSSAILFLKSDSLPIKTVFTTHATMLGRYIAMNRSNFYKRLSSLNWEEEAKHYNIEAQARIERESALASTVFTTVSDVTAKECKVFLGRTPDVILPNGLNIERFEAIHQFQNLHVKSKEKIHEFVMGHFFPSFSFDLSKTLYFITSGRHEVVNKGFDLVIDAMGELNKLLKENDIDLTIVTFVITKHQTQSINNRVLQSQVQLQKIKKTCETIEKWVGESLYKTILKNPAKGLPDLNALVSDYWKLRLRRQVQAWRTKEWPLVVTHNLVDTEGDEIIQTIRRQKLFNGPEDKVKIIYHPDFINPINPINHQEYEQMVRGCHMGIFPSLYEPWGYTPLECVALGIPTITSNLSGFGDYVEKNIADPKGRGIYILNRKTQSYEKCVKNLAEMLFEFIGQTPRERISQRYQVEANSSAFDWSVLVKHYQKAYGDD